MYSKQHKVFVGIAFSLVAMMGAQATDEPTDPPIEAQGHPEATGSPPPLKLISIARPEQLEADPVVCKKVTVTGSRFKKKKCGRQSAWDRASSFGQDEWRETERRSRRGS